MLVNLIKSTESVMTGEAVETVMTGAWLAATSPLSGRIAAGVTPLRRREELCLLERVGATLPAAPTAPIAPMSPEFAGAVLAGVNAGPADTSARAAAPQKVGITQKYGFAHYGITPHQSGTTVWKPPV